MLILVSACKRDCVVTIRPFLDKRQVHIGDSVFLDNSLSKIIITDSTYEIDSIIFSRYTDVNKTLKSINTYAKGVPIFENIYFHENGVIKEYRFLDDDNNRVFYSRLYSNEGKLISTNGTPFFQGFVTGINTDNLEVKSGTIVNYRIYYPNPPDCSVDILIKYDNGNTYSVFKKSPFINFLQTTGANTDDTGTFKTNVFLLLKEKNGDSVRYNRELFYKVVK